MELLIDIMLIWALFSVSVIPISLMIQIVTNIHWCKKYYAVIISLQKEKITNK